MPVEVGETQGWRQGEPAEAEGDGMDRGRGLEGIKGGHKSTGLGEVRGMGINKKETAGTAVGFLQQQVGWLRVKLGM